MRNDARATLTQPVWLSIRAYAQTYGLSRQTVYKLLRGQHLETYRLVGEVTLVRIRNVPPDEHHRAD